MTTTTLTIREARPETDYQRIATLISAASSEKVSAENIRSWDKSTPSGKIVRRAVALDDDSEIVGYSVVVRHAKDVNTQRFYVWVTVDSTKREQGFGTQMYQEAKAFALAQGARELISETADNDPDSLSFAQHRGFMMNIHSFASSLDLAGFDEKPFVGSLLQTEASGIRFSSLAAEGNTSEAQFKLYTLNNQSAQDNPSSDNEEPFPAFEIFQHEIFNADWFNPHGQLLAIDGDKYVGLGAVALSDERAYNAFTGVDAAYRGRGIAQALKLLTVRYSIANGARYLNTQNDSRNVPMLTINRKFGFVPTGGTYYLCNKMLSGGGGKNVRVWLTL